MFHRILVAIDGSVHADRALAESVDLARALHARLTIFVAVPQPPVLTSFSAGATAEFSRGLEAESEGIARDAAAKVPEGIAVETIVTRAPVREALLEQIETGAFDLLVMGSHGGGDSATGRTPLALRRPHKVPGSRGPSSSEHSAAPSGLSALNSGALHSFLRMKQCSISCHSKLLAIDSGSR